MGLDVEELRELFSIRLALETMAVRRAAELFDRGRRARARAASRRATTRPAQRGDMRAAVRAHTRLPLHAVRGGAVGRGCCALIRPAGTAASATGRCCSRRRARSQDRHEELDVELLEACAAHDARSRRVGAARPPRARERHLRGRARGPQHLRVLDHRWKCPRARSRSRAATSGGFSSFCATSVPEPAPRPGPGQVLAPMCQSRSTGVVCPGLRPNGRQRKFWSSESEPPYGSPCRRLTFVRSRSCGPERDALQDRRLEVRDVLREPRLDPVGVALAQLVRPLAVADVELAGGVALDAPRQLLELDPEQPAARRARATGRSSAAGRRRSSPPPAAARAPPRSPRARRRRGRA